MRCILSSSMLALALGQQAISQAPTGRISGVVTGDGGRPLEGAQIVVMGPRIGVITRLDGRYTLPTVATGARTIRASMLGFAPQTIAVDVTDGGTAPADFKLVRQAQALDQVVVTGYGTSSRRELTGAIASVSGEDMTLKAAPTSALSNALQGKAAGVQVTTNSGVPGAGASVRIRGTNPITANSEPLYVIDRIPAPPGTPPPYPPSNPLTPIT